MFLVEGQQRFLNAYADGVPTDILGLVTHAWFITENDVLHGVARYFLLDGIGQPIEGPYGPFAVFRLKTHRVRILATGT